MVPYENGFDEWKHCFFLFDLMGIKHDRFFALQSTIHRTCMPDNSYYSILIGVSGVFMYTSMILLGSKTMLELFDFVVCQIWPIIQKKFEPVQFFSIFTQLKNIYERKFIFPRNSSTEEN